MDPVGGKEGHALFSGQAQGVSVHGPDPHLDQGKPLREEAVEGACVGVDRALPLRVEVGVGVHVKEEKSPRASRWAWTRGWVTEWSPPRATTHFPARRCLRASSRIRRWLSSAIPATQGTGSAAWIPTSSGAAPSSKRKGSSSRLARRMASGPLRAPGRKERERS